MHVYILSTIMAEATAGEYKLSVFTEWQQLEYWYQFINSRVVSYTVSADVRHYKQRKIVSSKCV